MHALAGRKIYVLVSIPEQKVDVPRVAALDVYFKRNISIDLPKPEFDARQEFTRELMRRLSETMGFEVLDVAPYMCDDRRCRSTENGRPLYADDNHLSRTGAEKIRRVFAPVFPAGQAGGIRR
jgi:hypothetical protein